MWLFTVYGMFSVSTEARSTISKYGEYAVVRARNRAHLVNLQRRFPHLKPFTIQVTTWRDYRYRIFVPKATWVDVIALLAQEQTWDNFKEAAARFPGSDSEYIAALHDV